MALSTSFFPEVKFRRIAAIVDDLRAVEMSALKLELVAGIL